MSRDDVHFVGIGDYALGSSFSRSTFQKSGICIYILIKYLLITLIFLNSTKKKILEICAVQTVTTDKRMIVICVYRSPSGDFNHFLRLLDMALLSLNKPSLKILICYQHTDL